MAKTPATIWTTLTRFKCYCTNTVSVINSSENHQYGRSAVKKLGPNEIAVVWLWSLHVFCKLLSFGCGRDHVWTTLQCCFRVLKCQWQFPQFASFNPFALFLPAGRVKCEAYWPQTLGEDVVYGDLVVTKRNESVLPEYTIRIFDIKLVSQTYIVWSLRMVFFLVWCPFQKYIQLHPGVMEDSH